jgi:hypothetical protein
MDLDPAAGLPCEALSDALGTVDRAGSIAPRNEKMRSLLRALGAASLGELPIAPGDAERLAAGEVVVAELGGVLHELRCCTANSVTWFVAQDLGWPHRTAMARLALARARTVGGLAGAIVHDLSNLLGAGIGLADVLRPFVRDAGDERSLDELMLGARQGALLGRTVSRLLGTGPRERTVVPVAALLDEVLALFDREARRRGIGVDVRRDSAPAAVRVRHDEASQALLAGLSLCVGRGATSIAVECGAARHALGGGRERGTAHIRLVGVPLPADTVREVLHLVQPRPGLLGALARLGDAGPGLLQAVLAMACSGGELLVREAGAGIELDYVWPAVRAP